MLCRRCTRWLPRALVRRLRIGPIVPPEWRARADFSETQRAGSGFAHAATRWLPCGLSSMVPPTCIGGCTHSELCFTTIGPIVPPEWRARADFSVGRVCIAACTRCYTMDATCPSSTVSPSGRRVGACTARARHPHRAASAASEHAPPEYTQIPVLPLLRVKARQKRVITAK